jgi:hypothetical protein
MRYKEKMLKNEIGSVEEEWKLFKNIVFKAGEVCGGTSLRKTRNVFVE